VISLVEAFLHTHPEYWMTWIRPHNQLRYSMADKMLVTTRVGGHYRRQASFRQILPALALTCKHDTIARPNPLWAPTTAKRTRHDTDGTLIPRRYRVFVWV